MKTIATIIAVLMIVSFAGWASAAEQRPRSASPDGAAQFAPLVKAASAAAVTARGARRESFSAPSASTSGGNRLIAMQFADGGWGWPLTAPPTYGNILGPIAMGLAQAYQETGIPSQRTGLASAGAYLLAKTNTFSPSDGYLAAQLDKILGGTAYTAHVRTNYYDKLAAGTYNKGGAGTLFTTASYIALIRTSRSGDQANMAAWDIGIGLVGASMCGAGTADWIAGVKAEINELDGSNYYDVIGLAGAVYGLAFVGEPFDPTAGTHAAAGSVSDLAAILASYQISGGGFTWNSGYVSAANETNQETAYAILALNQVSRAAYLSNIHGAADYLMSVQLGTGGWDDYAGDPAGENNELTGEALWGIRTAYPPPVHNTNLDTYHPTIQHGIDFANAGNTLQVAAGTFSEGPQIVVSKNISVTGAGKLATIITPSGNTGNSGDTRGWFLVNAGVTFNLSSVTLDGTGRLVYMGILNKGSGVIDNCRFMNLKYNESTEYGGMGMSVRETPYMNVNVTNCEFSGMGRIGVHYRGPGTTGTVSGNTFTGKGAGNWLDYGIEAGGAALPEGGVHLVISNNTITNCTGVATDGSTSAGILVTTYFGPGTQATVSGCTVTGNTDGIAVGYDGLDASVVVAHNNDFSNNAGYGINSTNPYVDARNNYWGSLHGPSDLGGTLEVPRSPVPSVAAIMNAVPATNLGSRVTDNNVDYFPWTGPASGAQGGGVWAGGYVNPVSNSIFAGFDAAALDGVDGLDAVAPPPPPSDYLHLYFRTDPGQPIENYSIDIKKSEASLATAAKAWNLKAITDHTSSPVTIEFPDAGLPPGFKPTIYDLAANTHQNLRDFSMITYTSPPTESAYSFRLLMGDSTKPAVAVTAPNGGEFLVVGTPYIITWTSSDATGVLEHEVYYSLTGAAPYTLLATVNGATHSYPWTPALASLNASVKVVARDSVMNEDLDVSNHTFTILASNSVSFSAAAGWNLVSPPMLQGTMTPAALFGDDYGAIPYYAFQFSTTSGYSAPSILNMGQGYWLGSNSAQAIDAVGTPVTSASLALGNGFNIIGDPFAAGLLKADLRFTNGLLTKDMTQAASAGWLSNVLYGYSGGGYFVEPTTLGVWQGYWIPMMTAGITIQYSPTVVVPTPKEAIAMTPANWDVSLAATLIANGESFSDRIASFGVREDAAAGFSPIYDAPRPPRSPMKGYVEVSFPAKDEASMTMFGSSFARSFRTADKAAWAFAVNTSTEGVVTLSWDNAAISALPAEVGIVLVDKANHTTVDMKRSGSYSYAHNGTSHSFAVNKASASDLPAVPSAFSLSQNYPNPFNPTSVIQYGLPADAAVFLEVYNSLGQKVATLLDGQSLSAGYHQTTFNASLLSSGIYIYRLRATAADGTQFTQSRKMLLTR